MPLTQQLSKAPQKIKATTQCIFSSKQRLPQCSTRCSQSVVTCPLITSLQKVPGIPAEAMLLFPRASAVAPKPISSSDHLLTEAPPKPGVTDRGTKRLATTLDLDGQDDNHYPIDGGDNAYEPVFRPSSTSPLLRPGPYIDQDNKESCNPQPPELKEAMPFSPEGNIIAPPE